ncbi:MAG: hypothetical protein GY799_14765, partial [Desulfobulbaceae bacterium]|nr:hypothetical protein [Desulfobulbaceae bacterium]
MNKTMMLVVCLCAAGAVQANLIVNGGFEAGTTPTDQNWGNAATAANLPNWTYGNNINVALNTSGGVLGVGNDGEHVVSPTSDTQLVFADNGGTPVGSNIWQAFATEVGKTYEVSYDFGLIGFWARVMSMNANVYDGSGTAGTLIVTGTNSFSVVNGTRLYLPGRNNFTFVATSALTTLEFIETSVATNSAGMVIDNVVVERIEPVDPEEVEVYILSGQSNMQGLGIISELSCEDHSVITGAWFWNGTNFEVINPLANPLAVGACFGPELNFARRMLEIDPDRDIYLIKEFTSGIALDSGWNNQSWVGDPPGSGRLNFYPGETSGDANTGTAYTQQMNKVNAALNYLETHGKYPTIKGVVWMQGEQDSKNLTSATRYAQNLKRFSDRMHDDLGLTSAVPFVYGQVLPYEPPASRFIYRDEVRQSQANADADSGHAESFPNAYMVSTDQ